MVTVNLAIGMTFLLQTAVGILGNFYLLYHYLFIYFTRYRLRPTDLIVNNLIVVNTLVLISSGIHFTMLNFGRYHHLSDIACRLFPYVWRVGRDVSIGTTCLLSIFQAITISPMNSRWAGLKWKALKYIVSLMLWWWVMQMLVNIIVPIFMSGSFSNKNSTNRKIWRFCSSLTPDQTRDSLFAVLLVFPDVVCFVLMLWASGSMVFILYRHKQRVQHINRTSVSSQFSPESRAAKNILLLVSTFIFLNTLSSIFLIIASIFNISSLFVFDINVLIVLCFPTVSPFLIMRGDSSVSQFSFSWIKNIKLPHL